LGYGLRKDWEFAGGKRDFGIGIRGEGMLAVGYEPISDTSTGNSDFWAYEAGVVGTLLADYQFVLDSGKTVKLFAEGGWLYQYKSSIDSSSSKVTGTYDYYGPYVRAGVKFTF
jgi:hypothetical protein